MEEQQKLKMHFTQERRYLMEKKKKTTNQTNQPTKTRKPNTDSPLLDHLFR